MKLVGASCVVMLSLALSGCSITSLFHPPCVTAWEIKSLLGTIGPNGIITVGPSVQRFSAIGEDCDATVIIQDGDITMETPPP